MPAIFSDPAQALKRIRRVSLPLTVLVSIGLGLVVIIVIFQCTVLLVLPHFLGSLAGYVSFGSDGLELAVGGPMQGSGLVPIERLSGLQRAVAAGFSLLGHGSGALSLWHLLGLFVLYSRGVVFSTQNVRRMQHFGLWLVLSEVINNLGARVFIAVIHAPVLGWPNAAMAMVYGGMIYVIAHVMDLAREADLERKEFV
jgi:hypothetical protein